MRRSSKPIAILATSAVLVGGAVAHAATGSDGSDSTAADPAATATTPAPTSDPATPAAPSTGSTAPGTAAAAPGQPPDADGDGRDCPNDGSGGPSGGSGQPAPAPTRRHRTRHRRRRRPTRARRPPRRTCQAAPPPATGDGPVPGGGTVVVDRPPSVSGVGSRHGRLHLLPHRGRRDPGARRGPGRADDHVPRHRPGDPRPLPRHPTRTRDGRARHRAGPAQRVRPGRPARGEADHREARRGGREPDPVSRPAAWQTVFHFHIHVIPRYKGDPLVLPWRPSPGDPTTLDETAEALREHIQIRSRSPTSAAPRGRFRRANGDLTIAAIRMVGHTRGHLLRVTSGCRR